MKKFKVGGKKEDTKRKFLQFAEGETKIEWQPIVTTEVVQSNLNPIYLKSFTFASANYLNIELKVEVYQTFTGKALP